MNGSIKDLKGYPFRVKLQYIWDYYKLPLAILIIILAVFISVMYRHLTAKTPVLYLAALNVVTGNTLTEALTDGFLRNEKKNPKKEEVLYYQNLYLTDDTSDPDYSYAYASEIKLLSTIEAQKLDVVITDKKSYVALAEHGYLYDLQELFADVIPEEARLSGIASASQLFQDAGFPEDLYIGIIRNTPRLETAKDFLAYCFQ